jgi:hypothetical protein
MRERHRDGITNLEPSDRAPARGDDSGAFVTEHGGEPVAAT